MLYLLFPYYTINMLLLWNVHSNYTNIKCPQYKVYFPYKKFYHKSIKKKSTWALYLQGKYKIRNTDFLFKMEISWIWGQGNHPIFLSHSVQSSAQGEKDPYPPGSSETRTLTPVLWTPSGLNGFEAWNININHLNYKTMAGVKINTGF